MEDHEIDKLLKIFDRSYFPEHRDFMVIMLILDTGMHRFAGPYPQALFSFVWIFYKEDYTTETVIVQPIPAQYIVFIFKLIVN